jgi:hypothetical protein
MSGFVGSRRPLSKALEPDSNHGYYPHSSLVADPQSTPKGLAS